MEDFSEDSDGYDSDIRNTIFLTEASEASGDSDDAEDDDSSELDNVSWLDSFPQFVQLPIELRHRIWELFCPELTQQSRCFETICSWNPASEHFYTIGGGMLDQQTASARAVLATHHESRAAALRVLPDSLRLGKDGGAIVRFNRARDVVILNTMPSDFMGLNPRRVWESMKQPGFTDTIENLALGPDEFGLSYLDHDPTILLYFLLAFPNLRAFYVSVSYTSSDRGMRWCAADSVNCYLLGTRETLEYGIDHSFNYLYCWPDAERTSEAVRAALPMEAMGVDPDQLRWRVSTFRQVIMAEDDFTEQDFARLEKLPVWPLGIIDESGLREFDTLDPAWPNGPDGVGVDEESSTEESEPDHYLDEYESEGIDDSEIDDEDGEDAASDEDEGEEDDLQVLRDSSQDSSTLNDSDHDHGDGDGDNDDDGLPAAQFSSPEPEPVVASGSGNIDSSPGNSASTTTRRRPRPTRRVVSSEDGSDEEETQNPAKRSRRARVVLSDSEEEEEDTVPGNSGARDLGGPESSKGKGKARGVLESSSDEDEEDEEDNVRARPISLAQRLQLHRRENPVSSSESEDGSGASLSGGDYDTRSYADGEDDAPRGGGGVGLHGASSDGEDGGAGHLMETDADEESDSDI